MLPAAMGRRRARRWALCGLALLAALGLAEGLARLLGPEWRFVRRVMPQTDKELQTCMPDPDPRVVVRLRPGSVAHYRQAFGPFTVTVNALGHRGPERSPRKPAGVFRVLCLGGSNVYGAGLQDEQTWPAQLQARLDRRAPGRYEVWNLGVSGYNSLQMSAVGQQALRRYDPDLVLFALSNVGPRFFLSPTPGLDQYYGKDPTLWLELFPPGFLQSPPWLSAGARLRLLGHVGLYRLWMTARLAGLGEQRPMTLPYREPHYVQASRAFLAAARRQARVAVFLCPAVTPPDRFAGHYAGLDLPVLTLRAEGLPPEFRQIHPPPHVMSWYAEQLVRWLDPRGLLGPAAPPPAPPAGPDPGAGPAAREAP